jgi:hypothetical protein
MRRFDCATHKRGIYPACGANAGWRERLRAFVPRNFTKFVSGKLLTSDELSFRCLTDGAQSRAIPSQVNGCCIALSTRVSQLMAVRQPA